MIVEVQDYDSSWPDQFQAIKSNLELALKDVPYLSIEHVGSTSVPALCAKPVIDIDIVVQPAHLQQVIAAVTHDGTYFYETRYGDIPDRYMMRTKDQSLRPKRNLYVLIEGCQALRNHLAIRDLCRTHEEFRERYGAVKRDLSTQEWESVDHYCLAKTQVLSELLREAGFSAQELRDIAVLNGMI